MYKYRGKLRSIEEIMEISGRSRFHVTRIARTYGEHEDITFAVDWRSCQQYKYHGKLHDMKEIAKLSNRGLSAVYRIIRQSDVLLYDDVTDVVDNFKYKCDRFVVEGALLSIVEIAHKYQRSKSWVYNKLRSAKIEPAQDATYLFTDM